MQPDVTPPEIKISYCCLLWTDLLRALYSSFLDFNLLQELCLLVKLKDVFGRSCTDWLRKDSYLPNISFFRKCYPSIGLTIKKGVFSVHCQSPWVEPKTISRKTKCKRCASSCTWRFAPNSIPPQDFSWRHDTQFLAKGSTRSSHKCPWKP